MLFDAQSCHFLNKSSQILLSIQERLPFRAWMVTRLLNDDLIVLNAVDSSGMTKPGAWMPWSESLCSLMVAGQAPRLARCCDEVLAYRDVLSRRGDHVGAYMGAPIRDSWGRLIGTLCAVHDQPFRAAAEEHMPALESCASELASLYSMEIDKQNDVRRLLVSNIARVGKTSEGIFDGSSWSILTQVEEARHVILRHPVAFASVSVCRCKALPAAHILSNLMSHSRIVVSSGEGEFGLMVVGLDTKGLAHETAKIRQLLESAGIKSVVNIRAHRPSNSFASTIGAVIGAKKTVSCHCCAA